MAGLFSEGRIGSLRLENRMIRSASHEGLADERGAPTDFVSMARPLLLEPDLANKFRNGESEVAQCDNCNICVVATDTVPIRCHKDEFKTD